MIFLQFSIFPMSNKFYLTKVLALSQEQFWSIITNFGDTKDQEFSKNFIVCDHLDVP